LSLTGQDNCRRLFTAVSFPFLALAAHRVHTVQLVQTVTPSAAVVSAVSASSTAPFGFNFGDDIGSNCYNWTTVTNQLAILKSHGVTHLRIAYSGWNNPQSEQLALLAKNNGFYVIIGGDWDTFSQSQFNTYENEVVQEAKWAQANGIPQLSLDNEQEYRLQGVTQNAWASDLRTAAAAVRSVYSGKISYETSGDFAAEWDAQSLGDIDLLGLNLYNSYYPSNASALQNEINAHGVTHVYVSEINCDVENVKTCQTDAGLALEVSDDAVKLHQNFPSTQIYFFTFSAGGDGVPTAWGLFNGTTVQYPQTAALVGL
jgi:hypothetical protein